jgi:hypothetical protein
MFLPLKVLVDKTGRGLDVDDGGPLSIRVLFRLLLPKIMVSKYYFRQQVL